MGIDVNGQDTLNETPVAGNSVEAVLKELNELRKENKKLNTRLDAIFESPKAKKKLFRKRERPSVDPSCSDAVRRTYKELKKQKDDFTGFVTYVRFGHYK